MKFDKVLMNSAYLWAEMSKCERGQVGCVITKDNRILSTGYNGTISGADNCCEDLSNGKLVTKGIVLHAEQNALMFALREGISTKGATLYCTHAPCVMCAKLIAQAGIAEVVFHRQYRSTEGLELLASVNVTIRQIENII